MTYRVIWTAAGLQDLAAVWMSSADRKAVTAATPRVEARLRRDPLEGGTRQAGVVYELLEPPLGVDYAVDPDNPVAKDVLAIQHRAPGPRLCPIRWDGTLVGNMSIEGAYLYPLPSTATA